MKTIKLSISAMFAFTCIGHAGGNKAISETIPVVVESSVESTAFYGGLGISSMSLRNDISDEEFSSLGVMLQL